ERLGVAAVILAAGGVPDVPDRRQPGVLAHQLFEVLLLVEVKHLGDGADLFVRVDELISLAVERGHAGGQLSPVLNIQQQSRDQARCLPQPLLGGQVATTPIGKVINRRDAALVMQVRHRRKLRWTESWWEPKS